MIINIDTSKETSDALLVLASFYDTRAAIAAHLAPAVPTAEAEKHLNDSAEADGLVAKAIRDEVKDRQAKLRATFERAKANQVARHEDEWKVCFAAFNALPQSLRLAIRRSLASTARGECGTSDVNHLIFSEWGMNGRDFAKVIASCVDREFIEL